MTELLDQRAAGRIVCPGGNDSQQGRPEQNSGEQVTDHARHAHPANCDSRQRRRDKCRQEEQMR